MTKIHKGRKYPTREAGVVSVAGLSAFRAQLAAKSAKPKRKRQSKWPSTRSQRAFTSSYQRNPSTQTTLLILGGVLAAGGVAYYLYSQSKKTAAPATPVAPGTPLPPAVPGFPGLPGLPTLTAEQQALLKQIQTQIQAMPGVSQICKDKMVSSAPASMLLESLEKTCVAAPGSAGCAQLPTLRAQLDAMTADFNKACPAP